MVEQKRGTGSLSVEVAAETRKFRANLIPRGDFDKEEVADPRPSVSTPRPWHERTAARRVMSALSHAPL